MSSPLPMPQFAPQFDAFDPFEESTDPADVLKREVAARVAESRKRRGIETPSHSVTVSPKNSIAAQVAARFEQAATYQDFFAAEAEEARQKAEAAASLARRNAEIMAELAADLEEWNSRIAAANASNPHYPGTQDGFASQNDAATQEQSSDQGAQDRSEIQKAESAAAVVALATSSLPPIPPPTRAMVFETVPARVDREEPVLVEPDADLPTNLIEFPRQLVAARKARPRRAEGPLAAPVQNSQLRIFEVEADQISTEVVASNALPEWSSMRLEGRSEASVSSALHAQTSFLQQPQTAPLGRRVMAGLVDGCCVATAAIVFVMGVAWASPELPEGKLAIGAFAGVVAVLWMSYQMLFFTLSEATPGMRYARIGLCTFSDENPTRGAMRMRILATLMSAFPVGLGLLWACLDDDGLGWHDRISRMYQRSY